MNKMELPKLRKVDPNKPKKKKILFRNNSKTTLFDNYYEEYSVDFNDESNIESNLATIKERYMNINKKPEETRRNNNYFEEN